MQSERHKEILGKKIFGHYSELAGKGDFFSSYIERVCSNKTMKRCLVHWRLILWRNQFLRCCVLKMASVTNAVKKPHLRGFTLSHF